MNGKPLPTWKLPVGVCRATWDYLQSEHIANEYDSYFADSALMQLDMQTLRQRLPPVDPARPCVIADLGCGTGRVARQLLPLGYHMLNVDLSPAMLRELEAKTPPEYRARSRCLSANLVELDAVLEAASLDWAVCLFSSLGMIRGRQHRRRFLTGMRQALKPDGTFFVHVHNRYRSLFDPGGPSWLLRSWWTSRWDRQTEFGDRVYSYRRLPKMFLHIYSQRELRNDLRSAGLVNITIEPIDSTGTARLASSLMADNIRAGGFFAFAKRDRR
ncbi:MAG: class I SAM-dependent methyltransferase [Planctomycetales bacterium]|nr:class I SAM-dependent methyltransferase [Planctomycetales bacterium]